MPIDNYVIIDRLIKQNELKVGQSIWTQKGKCKILNIKIHDVELLRFTTNGGMIIAPNNCTVIAGGRKIKLVNSKFIDILRGPVPKTINKNLIDIMDGLMIGDGSVYRGSTHHRYLNIGKKDQDYFKSEIKDLILGRQSSTHELGWKITTNVLEEELPHLPERSIPERYIESGNDKIAGFLKGLYSANGTASGARIGLRSTNHKLIRQVQIMLSSIGIRSYVSYCPPKLVKWSNGEYTSKEAYDLNTNSDRGIFYKFVGFLQQYKSNLIANKLRFSKSQGDKNSYEIVKIESLGVGQWPQIKVENQFNSYWCNGLNITGD